MIALFALWLSVGGGVSGAESGVRDDTSSVRKTKQTDYRSEQRERERAGPGLMPLGVILCDLCGNYHCA